jgi:hypothetical protein
VIAAILLLAAFTLALDAGVDRTERRLMRWQRAVDTDNSDAPAGRRPQNRHAKAPRTGG